MENSNMWNRSITECLRELLRISCRDWNWKRGNSSVANSWFKFELERFVKDFYGIMYSWKGKYIMLFFIWAK